MIKKIAHLADIHIRRATDRHQEYETVFENLYQMLSNDKPDRIVIAGDLYNDYIEFQGEAVTLAGRFLNKLSDIAPVRVTRGNHDIRKKNLNRQDFIKTIIELLDNDRIVYYDVSGVYEDENVSWCVWHHPDKTGPDTSKAKGFKIDLFHDPIYSSVSVNGYRMDKDHYLKLDAFTGSLGLFGDIHQRQFFSNKRKAYPGSLVQQNYDEPLEGHGYLLWDTSDLSVLERDVHNDWSFHTLHLGPGTDFDGLHTEEIFNNKPRIRVKWVDNKANLNKTNEIKIREFLQQFRPIEVRIEKEALNVSMTAVASAQIEDIDDVVVQQEIFTEYLLQHGYKEEQIQEILKIDNEINKLMEFKENKGYSWKLKQLWLDNYKSYGDNIFLPLEEMKGLLQITGENAQGKTTILDAICYLLYGKTLTTSKKEKHGDARHINNKRDLDYCRVGGVIEINGKNLVLVRRTDRTMNKKGLITQCTTMLNVYDAKDWDGGAINFHGLKPDDVLTGELLRNTQKTLDEVLGDFNNFIRSVLTNADNLNEMLSIDRAEFIDSVNRDAGLDIFERKLEEYKNWKKRLDEKNPRINIDVIECNDSIDRLNAVIVQNQEDLSKYKDLVEISNKKIENFTKLKMDYATNIIPIDESLQKISQEDIEKDIKNLNVIVVDQGQKADSYNAQSSKMSQTFDNTALEKSIIDIQKANESVNECLEKWQVINSEIKDLDRIVIDIKNRKIKELDLTLSKITSEIQTKESDVKILTEGLNSDKKTASLLKESISELEKSKNCVTCDRELRPEDIEHIQPKIIEKQNELLKLKDSYTKKNLELESIKNEINILKNNHNDVSNNINLPNDLIIIFDKLSNDLSTVNEKIEGKKNVLLTLTEEGKKHKNYVLELQGKQKNIQIEQQSYVEGLKLKQLAQECLIKKEDYLKKILEKETISNSLKKIEKDIISNNLIKDKIIEIDLLEKNEKIEIDLLEKKSQQCINTIHDNMRTIQDTNLLINAYIDQLEKDKVYKAYIDCVHRDGVPTMLLKRMVSNINDEMLTLLAGQQYVCQFDENLVLKLSHTSKLEASQNAIESSGKERTFVSLALKMALKSINRKSKPNFVMFDEIMGKLINKSIEEFSILLNKITEKVESVFIIEHTHPIDFDHQLEIIKDEYDVSDIKIIN